MNLSRSQYDLLLFFYIELYQKWKDFLSKKNIQIVSLSDNLIDQVWGEERPLRPVSAIKKLDMVYCGESLSSKIIKIREALYESESGKKAQLTTSLPEDGFVVSALDEIAWALNLRGSDIPYNPVFFSYLWIGANFTKLYIDSQKIPSDVFNCL